MPNPRLDVEKHKHVQELAKQGLSARQIAATVGISVGAVAKFRHLAVPEPQGVRADKKTGTFNWRDWVPKMQAMQQLKRDSSYAQDTAFVELGDGKSPVGLIAFTDQHMGAWSTDYDALIRLTDEIINTPNLYIALIGDYGHYAIKLRSVLEVADNLLPPEQQTDFIESWFDDIWRKVACASWENHGVERQEKQAGESSTKRIMSRRVVWFNGIGHLDVKVGEQVYRGALSHCFRGRSIENPCHSQMRYMRREGVDREFAMAGDSHVPGMIKYTDGAKTRVAINTGSIQANSGYAKRYFSLTTHPVYPLICFHPDQHQMVPFWSIKEWLDSKG